MNFLDSLSASRKTLTDSHHSKLMNTQKSAQQLSNFNISKCSSTYCLLQKLKAWKTLKKTAQRKTKNLPRQTRDYTKLKNHSLAELCPISSSKRLTEAFPTQMKIRIFSVCFFLCLPCFFFYCGLIKPLLREANITHL